VCYKYPILTYPPRGPCYNIRVTSNRFLRYIMAALKSRVENPNFGKIIWTFGTEKHEKRKPIMKKGNDFMKKGNDFMVTILWKLQYYVYGFKFKSDDISEILNIILPRKLMESIGIF